MFPSLHTHAELDSSLADAVLLGKCAYGHSFRERLSQFLYRLPREFVPWIVFASGRSRSRASLMMSVVTILCAGSKPEMRRINARRIVPVWTVVKHAKSKWNGSFVENPRSPGCMNWRGRVSNSSCNLSIATRIFRCRPNPARFSFSNLVPESFWECWRKSLLCKVIGRNLDHNSSFNAVRVTGPAAFSLS